MKPHLGHFPSFYCGFFNRTETSVKFPLSEVLKSASYANSQLHSNGFGQHTREYKQRDLEASGFYLNEHSTPEVGLNFSSEEYLLQK